MTPWGWLLGVASALLVLSACTLPTTQAMEQAKAKGALGPFSKVASHEEAELAFARVDELLGISGAKRAVTADSESELYALFLEWKQRFGISYADPQEDARRFQIFQSNLRKIVGHNKNKAASYWMGLNKFAAMTPEEFNSRPGIPSTPPQPPSNPPKPSARTTKTSSVEGAPGYKGALTKGPSGKGRSTPGLKVAPASQNNTRVPPLSAVHAAATAGSVTSRRPSRLPSYFNWVDYQVVPFPFDQGDECGACWAVAAAAAMEAKYKIQYQTTYIEDSFSVQQLVSCATNLGCALGGWPQQAFEYASRKWVIHDGLYPFWFGDDPCDYEYLKQYGADPSGQWLLTGTGFKTVPPKSASALMAAVAKQPVVILLYDAGLQLYAGGTYDAPLEDCGTGGHALLLVGWSGAPGKPDSYWIAQNTLGSDWGEPSSIHECGGYIRLKMYPDRTVGLCSIYSYYRFMPAGGYYPTNFSAFDVTGCAYIVKDSDDVMSICTSFQVSDIGLSWLNPDVDLNNLYVGQAIHVPCKKQTPCTYVVKEASTTGEVDPSVPTVETLDSIAAALNTPVSVLQQLNPEALGGLVPGQVLRVPGKGCPTVGLNCKYTATEGDTLWSIADTRKLNVVVLQSLNPGLESDNLSQGQEISVPCSGSAPGRCYHKVKAGQTYVTIASLYRTTEDILLSLNGFAPLKAGKTIEVPCKGNLPK